jgi:hypothetical protein
VQGQSRQLLVCAASAAVPGDSSNSSKGSSSSEPVVFSPLEQRIGGICKTLTTLFPLWVVAAALLGFHHPPLFLWFNDTYVTWSLIFCMLAMVRGGQCEGFCACQQQQQQQQQQQCIWRISSC